jgi:polyphosphate kinase
MPRNLDRRVEILFPVLNLRWRETIVNDILAVERRDNVQARRLRPDGSYERLQPLDDQLAVNSQEWFLTRWKSRS